jgi:hypothetical protein
MSVLGVLCTIMITNAASVQNKSMISNKALDVQIAMVYLSGIA